MYYQQNNVLINIISFVKIYLLKTIETSNVTMKNNELIVNIQQARQHIRRLKKQAEIIDTSLKTVTINKQDESFNLNQYVNNALYSLAKNDNQIDHKVIDYKSNKLPSISQKSDKVDDLFYLKGYKKYKKQPLKKPLNKSKVNSFSTKADDSFSLTLQNRKIKIHSFNQKHKPAQINSQTSFGSILQHDPSLLLKQNTALQKQNLAHSSIRSRKYQQKVKLVNFNQESFIKSLQSQRNPNKKQSAIGYQSAVDNFSNHFFMIIKGRIANQSPQFSSYQRIYKSIFARIQIQISQLQSILRQFQIDFARFDGKKLAYLCLKQNVKRQQLIDCLIEGKQEVLSKMPQTKYKGKQGKTRAVNKIIAYWRMFSVRMKYKILKANTIKLQKFFRKKRLMLELQKKIIDRNQKMLKNFQQRQEQLQKNYKQIKLKKRIQIHLNSIQTDQQKRLTIQNFAQRQNIQLSRIFQLRDPQLILIYISSKQISQQLINYYYKILQLSNIENYKDRLFFLSPRQHKFPEHFSTTKLLYYCSRTLNQLKQITADMTTILFAGHPCNQLIKICGFLNCYLFSGQPNKMKQFMSKSQTKRLLKNLCIQSLPGSMEMYDYGQFLNTFSVLIMKNPQVMTWVLKIDDQFQGRGLAYIELSKSKIITSLIKKIEYNANSQFFTTDVITQPVNQQITLQIRDYLKQKLPQKLMIANPLLYRNYGQFMGRFIKKGGIIEAHPPCARQNLTFPSVSFCLQPDGQFKIICTYQKISSQPYRNIACSFPQKSLQYEQIISLCRQLTESFKIRKLFGYFTIDLVYYKKDQQSKYWVMGIEPFLNNYSSSFYLFDALMQGKYFPDKNVYLAQTYEQQSDNKSLRTVSTTSRQKHGLVNRQYVFIPHFLNKNFCKINIKEFFKQARIQQFNFDIANKYGVCMLLFDQLTSGQMGLLSVSQSKDKSVEDMKKILQFIARITQVKNVSYGKSDLEPSTDAIYLTDIMSKFLTLQRKQRKKDAKKKAFQKYKNKQDLQLII